MRHGWMGARDLQAPTRMSQLDGHTQWVVVSVRLRSVSEVRNLDLSLS
jgi:hypothetical protein